MGEHLTALGAAVERLLGAEPTRLSDDEMVEVLQRMETTLRKHTVAGEDTELDLPPPPRFERVLV